MNAKLVVESLEELFEKKQTEKPKEEKKELVDPAKEKAKAERSKAVKQPDNVKEKIAALKKVEQELEAKMQKYPGPISKKDIQGKLNAIREKIAKWNKKL
jgi:hypothetical protein